MTDIINKIDIQSEIKKIVDAVYDTPEQIEEAIVKLSSFENLFDVGLIQLRFLIGSFVLELGTSYGDGTVNKIAQKHRLHPNTLREAMRFAKVLASEPSRLQAWIDERTKTGNRLYWSHVQEFISSNTDPKVLGPKKLKERILKNVEKVGEDIEKVNELIETVPQEKRKQLKRELDGAVGKVVQEARQFAKHEDKLEEAITHEAPESANYLNFIGSLPCAVTGKRPVVVHHAKGYKGTGSKSSDYGTIPLSPELHTNGEFSVHEMGAKSFQRHHGVRFSDLIANYLHKYMTGYWLDMDLGEENV